MMGVASSAVPTGASAQSVMVDLGTIGGVLHSSANKISNNGQVVGQLTDVGNTTHHAFSWTADDGMVNLGTFGGTFSFPYPLNDRGQVVGISKTTGDAAEHAFSWTLAAGMVDLGTLGGTNSYAYAVNDSGVVVGWSHTAGNAGPHAFLWTATGGWRPWNARR